ncbi:MAG: sulfite exporter TauE/SafE family protein [Vicinamibacteria bacterium]|nr:sulfite exporter TauE/SafE family protein [Vicinamibacteria bacterium]
MDLALVLTGLVTGFVVGLTSTGGGALLTPALVLLIGVPARIAIGSDVLIACGMKLVSGGFYAWRGDTHWPTVWWLLTGSIPGALVGLSIVNLLPADGGEQILRAALGVMLVAAGGAIVFRLRRRDEPLTDALAPSTRKTAIIGFVIGVLVSVTSIGSGSLLLCALTLWFPLTARTAVGTDLLHALVLSTVVSAGHWSAGRVDLALVTGVLAGAIPGALAGAMLATSIPQRALRACLAATLVAVGLQLASSSVPPATTVATSHLRGVR